jgi:hypothetical protein
MTNQTQERTQAVKPIGNAPRRAGVALAVLATCCAVAACGSSSAATTKTSTSAANTSSTTRGRFDSTAFRTCLKQHGVTLPNRRPGSAPPGGGPPAGGGFFGGGGGGGGGGGQFANPKFRAAIQACGGGNFRGRGGRFRGRISHTAINNFVACVRTHGYPQMPSPNFSGKGSVFPSNIRTNSKFQSASKACASELVPPRSGGTSTNPGA